MTDTIQYSNSKELFQPTGLKEWKGFTVTRQLKEGESILDAAKGLIAEMDELHGLYGGNIRVDYSAIPGHPMNVQEPEKEAEDRNVAIDAYYQIINMKGASAKYLEKQRQHIEALNDSALTQHFNNKLKELQ